MQPVGNNSSCHLAQGMTLNPKPRSEPDIGLLVACKVQLSSEVIKWKTETLKLQKERDAAHLRVKELDLAISKMASRIQELEQRVIDVNHENSYMKRRSVAVVEHQGLSNQPFSPGLTNFHSFPWSSPAVQKLTKESPTKSKIRTTHPNEDWREVSQNLLMQMRSEMKDLQEMSLQFNREENKEVKENLDKFDTEISSQLQQSLSTITSETSSLKRYLLQQQNKLKLLFNHFVTADSPKISPKRHDSNLSQSPHRLTDQNYRDYFNRQLNIPHNVPRPYPESQLPSSKNIERVNPSHIESSKTMAAVENKVCPICQEVFDASVSQMMFEDHVVDHLECQSESLLSQYVLL